jgi:hypothetical protein
MRDRLPIITSVAALMVAVLGTTPIGQAAYNAVVPRNSVGTAQLKNNSVIGTKVTNGSLTGADVRNGSLTAVDFARGGLPGGATGPTGAKGDKGDKGDKGGIGPSDGYSDVSIGPAPVPTSGNARVATLRLPSAGRYLIWAKTWLNRPQAGQPTQFICKLVAGAASDLAFASAPTGLQQTLTNILAVDVSEATTVNLNCNASGASAANSSTITAIKVGSLTTSTG